MNPLAYSIFDLISQFIRYSFNSQLQIAYTNMVNIVVYIVVGVETIYILHYGYLIAFQKSTDDVPEPSVRDLIYHAVVVMIVLAFIKRDSGALDTIMAFRQMIIDAITGNNEKGGQQVAVNLREIDLSYILHSFFQPTMIEDPPDSNQTALILSIVAENSPQIISGVLLLMNEITVTIGMALFPLALYCNLYNKTSDFFGHWFDIMLGATIQISIIALLTGIVAKITPVFLAALTIFSIASKYVPSGYSFMPELQRTLIECGFGMLMTMMLAWLPAQAATFSGKLINAGTTKGNLGNVLTKSAYEADRNAFNKDMEYFREKLKRSNNVSDNPVPSRSVSISSGASNSSRSSSSGSLASYGVSRSSSISSGERLRNDLRARLDKL